MIIAKSATSLNNDNFFSNNPILTISFADSQFTKAIQLVLNQNPGKLHYFTIPMRPNFKNDYSENCNFFK